MNQKGLSLLEVLVAIGLSVGIALLAAQTIAYQKKTQRQLALMQLKKEIAEEIQADIGVYTHCAKMLKLADASQPTLPTIFLEDTKPDQAFVDFFDRRISHPDLKISSAKLDYKEFNDADIQKVGNSKVYKGTISLKASPRHVGQSNPYFELKDIKIPLTIYDQKGNRAWSDISCTNPISQTTSIISEACAYYGGILTDGTHCDFTNVLRQHYSVPEDQVPMQHASENVRMMQLPDIMCYVDTLISMIPDHDLNTRDPANDRYQADRTTKYCKRPGLVRASPTGPINMNEVLNTMSPDVKGFFKE